MRSKANMSTEINNEQENEREKIAMIAMQIVIHAGDARNLIMEALDEISEFKFAEAEIKLKEAQEKIREAHIYQTEVIQAEASGKVFSYSLLFSHAQDTVMTICTELNMAKKLCGMFKQLDKRFAKLESQGE